MGYNTTVIVLNDALDAISKDPDFGKKLADAILHLSVTHGESVDISALSHMTTLVAVGGNYGNIILF